MATIKDKYPTYQDFWNNYRTGYLDTNKDLTTRTIAVSILHNLYHYWGSSTYEPEEGVFFGKFFGQATTDIIKNSQQQEIIIFVHKTLKDKKLFETGSKIEHSKENQKIKATPQHTDFINIPYTQGEDMITDTYGRAQLLKQQKKELKSYEKDITKGRRISNEDGSIQYKDTYDKTENWGDKTFLGKLLTAFSGYKFDFDPKSYQFLFLKLYGASGYILKLPSGRRKWISTKLEEEEEEQQFIPKKKKVDDNSEISWEEWKVICQKENKTPTQQNFYLEQITRYLKRKEKERAPVGSLTALAIDKQKELAEGLIKAWEKDLNVPSLAKFEEVMDGVVGYNEFKNKMKLYLVNLAQDLQQGKKTEQTIYVLLGPPGIGKSFISEKVAEGMERPLINVDLGGRKDTGILEGVSPSVKAAYPGRPCQGISIGKNRGSIILLDEFEKVADEGLAMMLGNVLDIKKNKDWYDQFLGYRVDLSDCILLCTANYADQVPDFVQNRAEMVNIELATYQQRLGYVKYMLGKKLRSDNATAHYVNQLTDDFCKYIITEEWGYRQTNANIENVFKAVRAYATSGENGLNNPITDLTNWDNLITSKNRFIFTYGRGQTLSLVRVRTMNKDKQTVLSPELGLNWPRLGFECEPYVVFTK